MPYHVHLTCLWPNYHTGRWRRCLDGCQVGDHSSWLCLNFCKCDTTGCLPGEFRTNFKLCSLHHGTLPTFILGCFEHTVSIHKMKSALFSHLGFLLCIDLIIRSHVQHHSCGYREDTGAVASLGQEQCWCFFNVFSSSWVRRSQKNDFLTWEMGPSHL